jgi:hypothetical protein
MPHHSRPEHNHSGHRITDGDADTLEGGDEPLACVVSAGAVRQILQHESREDAENAGTDALKELHSDEPETIV